MDEKKSSSSDTGTANGATMTSGGGESESPSCDVLRPFRTYGWKCDPTLSVDDNLLDLLLIITRNSTCREGGMACIITKKMRTKTTTLQEGHSVDNSQMLHSILAVAINRPLYSSNDSDVHAEVCAIGHCASKGNATRGCTAYITMPPCKRCLAALVVAGIQTLVYPRKTPLYLKDMANDHNLTLVNPNDNEEWARRRKRVDGIIARYHEDHPEEVEDISLKRKQRREENKSRKQRQCERNDGDS
jgi:deoxycytidylate deaminase